MMCYGADPDSHPEGNHHEPTQMQEVENAVGDTQHRCPNCGVIIDG